MDYPLFWKLPVKSQAELMQWHYDEFGTKMNIPPAPDISSHYEATKEEDYDKIMREKPNPRTI